eukprot:gene7779-9128_t
MTSELKFIPALVGSPVPELNGTTSSTDEDSRPLVVVFGWMGSQRLYLSKYIDKWTNRGFNTLSYCPTTLETFVHQVATQRKYQMMDHICQYLKENPKCQSILFHCFSNGGGFHYKFIMEQIYSNPKYMHLHGYIQGAVFDSLPTFQMWAAIKASRTSAEGFGKVVQIGNPQDEQLLALLDGLNRFSGSMDYLYPIISKTQLQLKKLSLYNAYTNPKKFEDMAIHLGQSITSLELVLLFSGRVSKSNKLRLERLIFSSAFINVTKLRIIDKLQDDNDSSITPMIITHPTLFQDLNEKLALKSFSLYLSSMEEYLEDYDEYLERLHSFIVNHKTLRTFRYIGTECQMLIATLEHLFQSDECAISKMSLGLGHQYIPIIIRPLEELTLRTWNFKDSGLDDHLLFYRSFDKVKHIKLYHETNYQPSIDLRFIGFAVSAKSITLELSNCIKDRSIDMTLVNLKMSYCPNIPTSPDYKHA